MIGKNPQKIVEDSSDSEDDEDFDPKDNCEETPDECTYEVLEEFESDGYTLTTEDDELSVLTSSIERMKLKKVARSKVSYNLTNDATYLVYDFMQDGVHYCCVDLLVLTMGRDKFTPKVMSGGNAVTIGMIVPDFFFKYDRLEQANQGRKAFNKNSHRATAYEKALLDMRRDLRVKKGGNIQNPKVVIQLPFECEESIIEWVVDGFQNDDEEVVRANHPDIQVYYVLTMTLKSSEKMESDEEKKGTSRIYKSPVRTMRETRTRRAASTDDARVRTRSTSKAKRNRESYEKARESFESAQMNPADDGAEANDVAGNGVNDDDLSMDDEL